MLQHPLVSVTVSAQPTCGRRHGRARAHLSHIVPGTVRDSRLGRTFSIALVRNLNSVDHILQRRSAELAERGRLRLRID